MAQAWREPLTSLAAKWQPQVSDWERVFPGLFALIGLQGLTWPLWVDSLGRGSGPRAYDYTDPADADADELLHLSYGPAGGNVGWVAIAGPGTLGRDQLFTIMSSHDVMQVLSSLDSNNRVLMAGRGVTQLVPLIGRPRYGDQPVLLPVIECETVAAMLSDWQLPPEAATALAESAEAVKQAGGSEEPQVPYTRMAWSLWRELGALGLVPSDGARKESGSAKPIIGRLFARSEAVPFRGVVLLRGDHFGLWQQVKNTRSRIV